MRPKPPSTLNTPKVTPPTPEPGRWRPDADLPVFHAPPAGPSNRPAITADQNKGSRPDDSAEGSGVEISDLPDVQPETPSGLSRYLLNQALLRNMQAADDDGFRFVVGRRFVDVQDVGTVHVEFDAALNAYRARDLYNRLPPGPLLFRNAGEPTWSLLSSDDPATRAPSKRPWPIDLHEELPTSVKRPASSPEASLQRPAARTAYPLTTYAFSYFRMRLSQSDNASPTYLYGYETLGGRVMLDAPPPEYARGPNQNTTWSDLTFYSATQLGPDKQGYYRIPIKPAIDSPTPQVIYAFKDAKDFLVKVDPPVVGHDASPAHLPGWTDHEIWQRYNLHGADISRFRNDAHVSGTRPHWANPVTIGNARKQLLDDSFRWLYPQMPREERVTALRAYNLSPGQHATLLKDLLDNPRVLPQWAEQHRQRSLDADNPNRFDAMQQEIEPLLLPLRNGIRSLRGLQSIDKMVTRDFLDAFLSKLGYLRNAGGCLYRTDVPALFRADERTLFEFVDDGRMLPRMSSLGGTTESPISATVGMRIVWMYAGEGSRSPDSHHLRYNNQKNKYPGRVPGESDNEPSQSVDAWSDNSDVELDSERNYETTRHNQKINFIYVIDTRNLEVVLREENVLLNNNAQKTGAVFPEDDHEALISASRRGISSERIWLVDSTRSRAAKIDDIAEQADYATRRQIEEGTHNGQYNQHRYDALIDEVAETGKPILKMDKGLDTFASDIVWPE